MSTTTEKWTIFGERLKTELERQEMSLRQFAEKAGLTLTTACRYVHSQRTPRATEILKAAKVLGVTCDYMLGLSDDPHKTRDGWSKAGFHELPSAQPEKRTEERAETHACDLIDRQVAIDAIEKNAYRHTYLDQIIDIIKALPSAQPEHTNSCYTNSWCIDCKEYDTENKCCPRYNRVIKQTLDDAYRHGETEAEARYHAQQRWIPCSERLPDEYGEYRITWVTSCAPSKRFIGDSEYEVTSVWDEERKDFKGEWLLDDYIKHYPDVKVIAWKPLEEPYREEGD